MNAAVIRTHSIRPASGRALVRVSLCNGLGMLASQLDQCPNQMQALQAKPWDCANEEDQVSPGGGSA